MSKTLRDFVCAFLICIPSSLSVNDSFGGDFSLGPLFNVHRNEAEGAKEINALGPFITYKEKDGTTEFGIRPLFYWVKNRERESTEFDFIYPLSTYDSSGGDWRAQFLVYLLSLESNQRQNDRRVRGFTLFPLVFSKSAEGEEDGYFALFPIYGRVKDKFFRDEINFLLFPLYLQTRDGENTNNSFLWPFLGYYAGDQEGYRVWPLYGYRKKEDTLDEKFILWPIYVSKEREFYGERMKYHSVFPFYSSFESPQREQNTYLWPFFVHQVDREEKFERWDAPWPFVNFTRGSKYEDRVFPFYAKEVDEGLRQGFFLWPVYKYKDVTLEDHKRTRDRVLLFLYSDIQEKPTIEGGRSGRRIDVWPLFSYKRDEEGNRSFHFLSLLEPFLSGNKGIERNYSPLWRLYEWEKDKDGKTTESFLWDTYRRESSEEKTKIQLKPIIPVFSYKNAEGMSSVNFFGGLLGYRSAPDKDTLKLFFLPINVSSRDESRVEEVGKDE